MKERREFQRLYLSHPLDGWFGDFDVRLSDVSATGARIDHAHEIEDGSRALLTFRWRDIEIELLADTVRNDDGSSGVHFVEDSPDLRHAIAASAEEVLRAQEANAMGLRTANRIDGDQTLTAASALVQGGIPTFVSYSLTPEGWVRRQSLVPDQPEDGFTVSSAESEDQVELLCATYASGDEESRRMTRLLAELSVADAVRGS